MRSRRWIQTLLLLPGLLLSGEPDALAPAIAGKYAQVKDGPSSREKAAWAFARFHLSPGKDTVAAAQAAHDGKETLGTFVLLLCHREGVGLRASEKTRNRLNFELRTVLEKKLDAKQALTPLEEYMFSQLMDGDENGVVKTDTPEKSLEARFKGEDSRWNRLVRAAEQGVAQAMDDVGSAYQNQEDYAKAYTWYERAAKSGLAAGMKNQGYFQMQGRGTEKNAIHGLASTLQAAEAGDVYAQINMGVFSDRGMGVPADGVEARKWIDRAVAGGHFQGLIEKGLALLEGHYGYAKNEAEGKALLQKAAQSGSGDALMRIGGWYARGTGLKMDGKKAVAFGEAAFVQGKEESANMLAWIYKNGLGDVKPDEKRASYWSTRSNASMAYAFGLDDDDHPMKKYLDAVDPFAVKVE